MADEDHDAPDTPRVCEACGGNEAGCGWCTGGFQDPGQQDRWREFRMGMRKISETYSLLEDIMWDIVGRLDAVGTKEASDLSTEGRRLLKTWLQADPDSAERRQSSLSISMFQKRAVLELIKSR